MYDLGCVRVDEKEPGVNGVSLSEAPKANSGGRVLKMGTASPLPEGEVWERCKFPQRGPGWSPDRSTIFLYFAVSRQLILLPY